MLDHSQAIREEIEYEHRQMSNPLGSALGTSDQSCTPAVGAAVFAGDK